MDYARKLIPWITLPAVVMVVTGLIMCGWVSSRFFPDGLTAGALNLSMQHLSWVFLVAYFIFMGYFAYRLGKILRGTAERPVDLHSGASKSFPKLNKRGLT